MGPKSVYFAGFLKNFITAAVIWDLSYNFNGQDSLPYSTVKVKLFRRLRLPEFLDNRYLDEVRLSTYAPAAFNPMGYSQHQFLPEAESTPAPQCGR